MLVAVSPLLLAAAVLAGKRWVPVLDMGMTELRLRDVFTADTPLVGLPGRIGNFPEQGSHPGPLSFYLVAPLYRLAGSRAWGMEFASVVLNAACAGAVIALLRRRFGQIGVVLAAAIVAVAVRGYGLTVLIHPWNPYFPVMFWLTACVAAWLALDGQRGAYLVLLVTTVVAAQTHVSYLFSAVVLDVVVTAALVVRRRRAGLATGQVARRLAWPAAVVTALWIPPVLQQLTGRPANISLLVRHFATDQPEPAIPLADAIRLVLHHVDVPTIIARLVVDDTAFVDQAGKTSSWALGGLLTLAVWVVAAHRAWRRRRVSQLALHAVVATTLIAGAVSISRIFGKVWFYLTLWMPATTIMITVAIAWSAVDVWRQQTSGDDAGAGDADRADRSQPVVALHDAPNGVGKPASVVLAAGGVVTLAMTACSLVAAAGQPVPERELGDVVAVMLPRLLDALDEGVGAADGTDARYVVFWQEGVVPGAQGYAVLTELERAGYDVGVHPTWRVPATEHRVRRPGEFDAEVHIVSGGWLETWATDHPGAVEVARHDPRSASQRARFDALLADVTRRLTDQGRADLAEIATKNIFGVSLNPDIDPQSAADLAEMLLIGQPAAVFVAPAGSTR